MGICIFAVQGSCSPTDEEKKLVDDGKKKNIFLPSNEEVHSSIGHHVIRPCCDSEGQTGKRTGPGRGNHV